jgi:putative membrane protein
MTMSDEQDPSRRFEVRATSDSHFAWLRTRFAVERTMMAYQRTAVSLIGFGFAIVQFFQNFHQMPRNTSARFPDAAWYLGLALISCGVLASVFSVLEYRRTIRYLWSGDYAAVAGMSREVKQTPLFAVSFILVLIGVFAFFAVVLHLV